MAKGNQTMVSELMGNKAMGNDTLGSHSMKRARLHTKGFTLIASMLMLLLLSGIAIGLLMMVTTETKVGSTDLQNNGAYHNAEGGIEKMSSDLASVFQNAQSPTAAQICGVGLPTTNGPTMTGVTWKDYTVTPGPLGSACPASLVGLAQWGQISGSGQNAGLWAQIIPVNLLATASLTGGQEVSMMRSAQVALIPVFQFGVFCEGDCAFFSSPNLDFAGRVHTNADLYVGVSDNSTLTFHDKLEAYGNIVTKVLPNGLTASSNNDSGTVLIPKAASGCDGAQPNCGTFTPSEGSVTGAGGNPPQSGQNVGPPSWSTISLTTFNSEIIDGDYGSTKYGTGAKKLNMPFVSGTNFPYQIIRRPPKAEDPASALSQAREYNMAQIHVLLSDNPADLPGGAADTTNNIRLANVAPYPYGVPTSYPTAGNWKVTAPTGGNTYNTYFATAMNGYRPDTTTCGGNPCPTNSCTSGTYTYTCLPADWPLAPDKMPAAAAAQTNLSPANLPLIYQDPTATDTPTIFALCPPTGVATATIPAANIPPGCPTATAPVSPYLAPLTAPTQTWNLIDGWLRVEYRDASGNWNPVTQEWLGLGFARDLAPPTLNAAGSGAAGGFANDVNPNAILLLQEPTDRNGDGKIETTGTAPVCTATNASKVCTSWKNAMPPDVQIDAASSSYFLGLNASTGTPLAATTYAPTAIGQTATNQSITMSNWYPINFYDAREGEPRDTDWGNDSGTTNGVMNAVEIDVGNLKLWLAGTIGTSGTKVDYVAQNGYVLYFSDRRGMLNNPNFAAGNQKTGDSGLEDVVNAASATGVPDGVLEATPPGHSISPEDVNQNGVLDEWGTGNLGLGQWPGSLNLATNLFTKAAAGSQNAQIIAAAPDNPYTPRIATLANTARKNWVSGARHVLKLVDGSLGNVPLSPTGGGFTVASENPVYILGDYNSNSTDPFWKGGADAAGHSPSSVISDAVTVLSNNWSDLASMVSTDITQATTRPANNTYYRLAVAGGKNLAFPFPAWENGTDYGFGTDGGIHNFLRFLEDWQTTGASLNYGGSLVSLYYATYNTGLFKCCTYSVYQPPTRNYIFDSDFTNPSGLPPGTPMFRDVESLGYRQLFVERSSTD
jgi:hypothetical protein